MKMKSLILSLMIFCVQTFLFVDTSISYSYNRFALVICNQTYPADNLNNNKSKANRIANALERSNFTVKKLLAPSRENMKKAIKGFYKNIKTGGVGLFYYSGYALQKDSVNFLIPSGVKMKRTDQIISKCISLNETIKIITSSKKFNSLFFIDASFDGLLNKSLGLKINGLSKISPPDKTFLTYATSPGQIGSEYLKRKDLFTSKFLSYLEVEELELHSMISRIKMDVKQISKSRQKPWWTSSLRDNFYFNSRKVKLLSLIADLEKSKKIPWSLLKKKYSQWCAGISTPNKKVLIQRIMMDIEPKHQKLLVSDKIKKGRYFSHQIKAFNKLSKEDKYINLFVDLQRYDKIKNSSIDRRLKLTAWQTLKEKYPQWSHGVSPLNYRDIIFNALSDDKDQSLHKIALKKGIKPRRSNYLGMNFVYIPAGEFIMGSPYDEPGRNNDEKQYMVKFTRGFYISETEVTQKQWKTIMGYNPSIFIDCGENCPVENISWEDIQKYISKLNSENKNSKIIFTYRLPTEAQWEYACRAGNLSWFSFGDDETLLNEYAWFGANSSGRTHPVAQKKPNKWGLYDMHGNVWEWCNDWGGKYQTGKTTNPHGPLSGQHRIVRGGSWHYQIMATRCANRNYLFPNNQNYNVGFRLVMEP